MAQRGPYPLKLHLLPMIRSSEDMLSYRLVAPLSGSTISSVPLAKMMAINEADIAALTAPSYLDVIGELPLITGDPSSFSAVTRLPESRYQDFRMAMT
jgi:hypothetical protein